MNLRKLVTLASCLSFGLHAVPILAQPISFKHDFEGGDDLEFHIVPGQKSEGSTLSLWEGPAHSGHRALKLDYQFTGRGFIQCSADKPSAIPEGETVPITLWVFGARTDAFTDGSVRMLDATNETYQYSLPAEFAQVLNGDGWQQFEVSVNLNKPLDHWGGKGDGKVDYPLRFLGFSLSHGVEKAVTGSVLLDDLSFSRPTGTPAAFTLEPVWEGDTPCTYIYPPGKNVRLRAEIGAALAGRTLIWRARDFDGHEIAKNELPFTGREAEWQLPPGRPGIAYVAAEVRTAEGQVIERSETRVGYAEPAPRTVDTPLIWGVNSHPERCSGGELEREAALISTLGFTTLRGGPGWIHVQPNGPAEWNWAKFDEIYAALGRHNVRWAGEFLGTPRWASGGRTDTSDWTDWGFAPPRDPRDWAKFVEAAVRRYGDRTKVWEIWNEPDVSFWRGSPEAYAALFDAAFEAIKRVQPDSEVLNGGFSETNRAPDFIARYMKAVSHRPDGLAFHTHMQFSNLLRAQSEMQQHLKEAGWSSEPIFLNEAGFSTSRQLTERDQAAALIKKMTYSAVLGHRAYFWYDLRNDGSDPNELEHNFGLVRRDFTPKAAALAARTLISQLSGTRFVRRMPAAGGVYALLFEAQGESRAVVWNESPSGAQMPMIWKADGAITTISAMGQESAVNSRGGISVTNAGAMPKFLRIEAPADSVALVPEVLQYDTTIAAPAGGVRVWHAKLVNPWQETWNGELKLRPENGWTVSPVSTRFQVEAGKSRSFDFTVKAPEAAKPADSNMVLSSPGLPEELQAQARLTPAIAVPRWEKSAVVGDLSRWAAPFAHLGTPNTVSLFEATPMQNLHFHGEADLSADAYLARVPDGLLVTVDARDDQHFAVSAPGEEWKGDSLQCAMALASGGTYEWTCALTDRGPRAVLTGAPAGVALGPVPVRLNVVRHGDRTLYALVLPDHLPGSNEVLPETFAFNLLVNDNDGDGRKGWVEFTPGIGRSKDASQFQQFVVR